MSKPKWEVTVLQNSRTVLVCGSEMEWSLEAVFFYVANLRTRGFGVEVDLRITVDDKSVRVRSLVD